MQQLLARHLLHHHFAVFPGLGTVRLVLSPAEMKEETVSAPQYLFAQRADEDLLEQQLQNLASIAAKPQGQLHQHLVQHTTQLMQEAQSTDVAWPGVGTWTHSSGHYSLRPPLFMGGHVLLPPRQLAQPQATEDATDTYYVETDEVEATRRAMHWPAWLALALVVLAIIAYFVWKGGAWKHTGSLYRSGWLTSATTGLP